MSSKPGWANTYLGLDVGRVFLSRNIFDASSTPEFSPLCPQSQCFLAHRKPCPNCNPKIITWHPRVPPGLAGGFGEPGRGPEAGGASLEGGRRELGESPKVTCPFKCRFLQCHFPARGIGLPVL